MELTKVETEKANYDDRTDDIISQCMNPNNPQSFFLYAGAGSGKTRSLVNALVKFSDDHGLSLYRKSQQVAVITYTNAACDEIQKRVTKHSTIGNRLFCISTIHSFCWQLIKNFHSDIQVYLLQSIPVDICKHQEEENKGRKGTKASFDRLAKIQSLEERLQWLALPREFTYNPNGDNFCKASLSHAEVLKITADFVSNKPVMRMMIAKKYPFILIDESQDTNKGLIEAFFILENDMKGQFALGLIGDQMQRIYMDGKEKLLEAVPDYWARPEKKLNHRCPLRVIQLSNAIRSTEDKQYQKAPENSEQGVIRIFAAPIETVDKNSLEERMKQVMKEATGDVLWLAGGTFVKSLTLEHHMAARRMGFYTLFTSLDSHPSLKTGLRDGTLSALRFFSEIIEPVIQAYNSGNRFELMALCRAHSGLLEQLVSYADILELSDDPLKILRDAVNDLVSCSNDVHSTFEDVLKSVRKSAIFTIPNVLMPFVAKQTSDVVETDETDETQVTALSALRKFLESPYNQIRPYIRYIEKNAGEFDTHQGVKGREFERVFVVIDDNEARGRTFSYDKIFGIKAPSASDIQRNKEGKETSMDKTLRLLYVTCTRAEKSLALVVYSVNPKQLAQHVVKQGWFSENEVLVMQ
jgi:DNA helicase-2/ATP-dependent DNA helicase PcrA